MPVSLGAVAVALALGTAPAGPVPSPSTSASPAVASGERAAPYQWDVPEVIQAVDAHGVTMVDGIPVRMTAVVSRWRPERLAQHFMTHFENAGLWVPPPNLQSQGSIYPQLNAFDPDRKWGYTVIFQPNADGSTTVLLGSADVSKFPNVGQMADFAPVMPGAHNTTRTQLEGMRHLLFETKAEEAEVRDYYRTVLSETGYAEEAPGEFVSSTDRIHLRVASEDGKRQVSLSQLLRVGARASESVAAPGR